MGDGKYNKIIAIVLVLLIIAFFAYAFFIKTDTSPDTLTSTESSTGNAEEVNSLLASLRAVSLSSGIFTNKDFVALSNFNLTLVPFPAGRNNPFAPIGL